MVSKIRSPLDINYIEQDTPKHSFKEFYEQTKDAEKDLKLSWRSRWFRVFGVLIVLMFVAAVWWWSY